MSFTFSQTAGTSGETTITVSATSREDFDMLVENFTLSNDNESLLMSVVQKGVVPVGEYLTITPSAITFPSSGGNQVVIVQSNVDWTWDMDEWMSASIHSGTSGKTMIPVSAFANSGATRIGVIKVSGNTVTASTVVHQQSEDTSALYYTTTDNQPIVFGSNPFAPANVVSHTFVNGQGKVTFDVPLTAVQASAFNGQTTLNSIYIPNTVSYYDIGAFAGTSLEYFETGDLVDKVNQSLLSTCSSLKTVVIGSSVESLHGWCLAHCSSLETIYCYATTAPILNDRCFEDTTQTTGTVHYPAGSDYSSWMNNKYNYLDGWTFIEDI